VKLVQVAGGRPAFSLTGNNVLARAARRPGADRSCGPLSESITYKGNGQTARSAGPENPWI
jgi:hypothetical protein